VSRPALRRWSSWDLEGTGELGAIGDRAHFIEANTTEPQSVSRALDVAESLGQLRINVAAPVSPVP
jgi:hypothetical protein